MRVKPYELALWSFLMATAHGAGLILVPVLAHLQADSASLALTASGQVSHAAVVGGPLASALLAVALHTVTMFLGMGLVAVVVYQKVGVEVLRRAWVNLDLIWVGVLVLAGLMTLGFWVAPASVSAIAD